MTGSHKLPAEPADRRAFTQRNDRLYGHFAGLYDLAVKILPFWRRWIEQVLPHIVGPRVLELSFGTGHLLTRYADRYETWAIDYNWQLAQRARHNLSATGQQARLQLADVAHLPFADNRFHTVLCTMAFTAYPDGNAAMAEIARVLIPGGRLLLVDVNYPVEGGRLGTWLARAWIALGDIIRDMAPLFAAHGFDYVDRDIGGFGSVHLYVARKLPHIAGDRRN